MFAKTIAVTALAVAAISVPAASAVPMDLRAPDQRVAVVQSSTAQVQDLRSPDSRPGATPVSVQDLRSADTRDVADGIVVSQIPAVGLSVDNDGFPWLTAAAGIALLLLIGSGAATSVRMTRNRRRSNQPAPTS